MDYNQFGDNLEDSANFLIEKLKQLHPWDDEWKYNIAVKLVPIYTEVIDEFKEYLEFNDLEFSEENFDNIIKFSSILTKDQLKILFMGDLSDIPLIYDGKYLSDDEMIDLLIEYKNNGALAPLFLLFDYLYEHINSFED